MSSLCPHIAGTWLINLANLKYEAFSLCVSNASHLLQVEVQDLRRRQKTRLTNAKEISVDATVAAVSSQLGGIFTLKEDKGRHSARPSPRPTPTKEQFLE